MENNTKNILYSIHILEERFETESSRSNSMCVSVRIINFNEFNMPMRVKNTVIYQTTCI